MNKIQGIYFFIIIFSLFLNSCSNIRKSAGVTRKSIDEFQVIENPPLIIPPDFNLLPPEDLKKRNIDFIEKELAQEILFGLDENISKEIIELSPINKILSKIKDDDSSASIREDIDKEFYQEVNSDKIFKFDWEDQVEVLDAIKESKRIRESNFKGESIAKGDTPTKTETIKKKKKKRFIWF